MEELIGLILKGLTYRKVRQSPSIWGAQDINGVVWVNVIGLALIGRVGVKFACELTAKSMDEAGIDQDAIEPITEVILRYLGLHKFCQLDSLAALNHNMSAKQIVKALQKNPTLLG
jgi:hypothetical protein